jgi:hypothetical protein
MEPWLQYPPGDPLSNPSNWFQELDGTWTPNTAAGYATGGLGQPPSYGSGAQPVPPLQTITVQPAPRPESSVANAVNANQAANAAPPYEPYGQYGPPASQGGQYQTGYPAPPATTPQPVTIGGGGMSSAPPTSTIGMGTGQTDFATPNYPVLEALYTDYQNQLNGGTLPTTTAPLPPTAAPTVFTENAPSAGAMNAGGNAVYGGPGGGGNYGGGGGGTYPYPALPGGSDGIAPNRQFNAGAFDPFVWSGTQNPLPPSGDMRNMVLGNMGNPGPVWYPAGPPPQGAPQGGMPPQGMPAAPPPRYTTQTMPGQGFAPQPMQTPPGPTPAQQQKALQTAMQVGQQIAEANMPQGPRPMSGLDYVAGRLKLNPTGY